MQPHFDALIVSTSSEAAARWWSRRLAGSPARIATVVEDRPLGNGGGSLHAVRQAGFDVVSALRSGQAVAVYHTAGKGTRLAPLPLAEGADKSRVKLPGLAGDGPITLLEAVIRQTAPLAVPGRLSVFWGDQLFLPSVPPAPPTHPAALLVRRLPAFDAATWRHRELHRYGVVALDATGDAVQVEKTDHAGFRDTVAREHLDPVGVAVSLGSFSVTAPLLQALLDTFGPDERLDTDPHFWMPATLSADGYAAIRPDAGDLHARMAAVKRRAGGGHLLGVTDIGDRAAWWDFGTLSAWWDSVRAALHDPDLRRLLGVEDPPGDSLVLGSRFGSASVPGSVVIGVDADRIDVADSVVIGVRAPEVHGRGGVLYNVVDEGPVRVHPGEAVADVTVADRRLRLRAPLTGAAWDTPHGDNPASFAAIHRRLVGGT